MLAICTKRLAKSMTNRTQCTCAEAKCSCSTYQYEKLEAIQISRAGNSVSIALKPKNGETIERADIEKCLGYAAAQAGKS